MKVLDLFSGIGGFSLGLERCGMKTIAFCEYDEKARLVLKKHWPEIPIYKDVRVLTGEQIRKEIGTVDVICGGFPCQDISISNNNPKGIEGERSGLWSEIKRLLGEVRPRFAVLENVAALYKRGLSTVLGDLAEIGFNAEWHCVRASHVGGFHRRERIWILAYPQGKRLPTPILQDRFFKEGCFKKPKEWKQFLPITAGAYSISKRWENYQSVVCGDDDGVPEKAHRLKQLGNAVVPQVVEVIGHAIMEIEKQGNGQRNTSRV